MSFRNLVFVPSYNDTTELPRICRAVETLGGNYTVLVVDDGSDPPIDATLLPPSTIFFRAPDNLGLGVATHIAMDCAVDHGFDTLVRVDSDGQHPIDCIPDFVALIAKDRFDVVFGARSNLGESAGLRGAVTRYLMAYYRFMARSAVGAHVPDPVTGFHALSRRACQLFRERQLDRYPEPEIIISSHILGLRVAYREVKQGNRAAGTSTINLFRAVLLVYRYTSFVLGVMGARLFR